MTTDLSFLPQKFETKSSKPGKPGQRITLTILEMDIEPGAEGWIDVYDNFDGNNPDRKLASYEIINGTMPQGITSTLEYMFIEFRWVYPPGYPNGKCEILRDCVKVTILVDAADCELFYYVYIYILSLEK